MDPRHDEMRQVLMRQLQRDIQPGLKRLPVELGTFADFRTHVLATASQARFFPDWQPQAHDPGLMLLEMWAYVCDVVSFYEAHLTGEAYLRTARKRSSLRRLVGLLGYTPRPAVAAQVMLAVTVDSHWPVPIPSGTAVQSGEVDDGPPQIFEVTSDTTVDPARNRFDVTSAPPETLADAYGADTNLLHLENHGLNLRRNDDFFVVGLGSEPMWLFVQDRREIRDIDGERIVELQLGEKIAVGDYPPEDIRLLKPTRQARAEQVETESSKVIVVLDALYPQIRPDHEVVLEWGKTLSIVRVQRVSEPTKEVVTGSEEQDDGSTKEYKVELPRTALEFSNSSFPNRQDTPDAVYFQLLEGGRIQLPSRRSVDGGGSFEAATQADLADIEESTRDFAWTDARDLGAVTETTLELGDEGLALSAHQLPPMRLPLRAWGNLVEATRGETVRDEVLGSGDASQANQSFELSHSPLTYLRTRSSQTAHGMTSTLSIYVDGVQWREVPYFFGAQPDDQVYTVREDDEGVSTVRFGDGRRGARLPTGRDNVVAHYRVGAGRAAPDSQQIEDWLDKPDGVGEVVNPVAAFGGDDPQRADEVRAHAPSSALLLGRAVSLHDLEAAALDTPGIDTVRASWRWHPVRQTPVATIWFIGGDGDKKAVADQLKSMTDPALSLDVRRSEERRAKLAVEVVVEADRASEPIRKAVHDRLAGDDGLLRSERIGIGGAVFSSQLFEAVWSVDGVASIQRVSIDIQADNGHWDSIALDGATKQKRRLRAGEGHHFEFDLVEIDIKREE